LRKVLLIGFVLLSVSSGFSQYQGIGLGIILGEPTGITAKHWLDRTTAIDAAVAWSFVDGGAFHIHADYLLHNFNLISVESGKLPFYYGIGGRIKTLSDVNLGVRVPLGLSYIFTDVPVDIFLEIVPLLDLIPKTNFRLNAAIGSRYYFTLI
jgi:hypothetical protein